MAHVGSPSAEEVYLEDFGGDGLDYSRYFETGGTFDSLDAAIEWAKSMAVTNKFELVIDSHKGDGRRRYLRCNRGVRYRGASRDRDPDNSRKSKTKSCGCKFRVTVCQVEGGWIIHTYHGKKGTHNHRMAVYKEGYRQMSGLSPASKMIVRDMTSAQVKPSAILAAVREKFPADHAHPRQVYNYRDNLKRQSYEGRGGVVEQFFHLAVKHDYIHHELSDPVTRVLTHIFMAHPTAVSLLKTFPYWIGLDSTYKTNRYRKPLLEIIGMTPANKNFLVGYVIMNDETEASYRWALFQLRLVIGEGVHPYSIATDREMGLMKPLREFFPDSYQVLCSWHIGKDVENQVYKLTGKDKNFAKVFKSHRWRQIVNARTEVEYEEAVANMKVAMSSFPLIVSYVEKTWLVHKEKFVKAWTNQVRHMGNTTTCRVESSHAQLKGWLNTSTGALDTVWTKIHNNFEHQMTEIR